MFSIALARFAMSLWGNCGLPASDDECKNSSEPRIIRLRAISGYIIALAAIQANSPNLVSATGKERHLHKF